MPIPTPDSIVDAIKHGELPPVPTQAEVRAWMDRQTDICDNCDQPTPACACLPNALCREAELVEEVADLRAHLRTLADYLEEAHAQDKETILNGRNHGGDGQASCSYCRAIRDARKAVSL